ncbi:MAG TPA: DinB family protein [Candidatus Eisenbacteria bacterium]|nr:DinB family protein [Candidatus Eisenbacteria bacterium]
MNLADYIRREFSYNSWANQEVINAMGTVGGQDKRSLQLMSHIFAAERLWLERLKQKPQSTPVWPELDLKRCQEQLDELSKLWDEYLELITSGDILQTTSYKNSKGEPWTSSIVDVLTHVVMHSAYHRGQIASHMRESGRTPAYTDFIHAIRQGFVK